MNLDPDNNPYLPKGKTPRKNKRVIWPAVPADPLAFYEAFGYFSHPKTREPIKQLADYQVNSWRALFDFKRVLEVKSNKVGESTKWLLADFHLAILPASHPLSCRGYDQLVVAQSKDHAKEHLRTLRKMIIESPRYASYLINKPTELAPDGTNDAFNPSLLLKDEQSKTSVIYIHNPDNPRQPSRIIAAGIDNEGTLLSWKRIHHIHASDITAVEAGRDIEPSVNAMFTRLANTDGSMVIESVPGLPQGKVFDLWRQYSKMDDAAIKANAGFKVIEVTADDAVRAGVISDEFLRGERLRLGIMFPRYYGAKFMQGEGNIFPYELIQHITKEHYSLSLAGGTRAIGVDPAYGSSNFAIVLAERRADGRVYILDAKEYSRPSPDAMYSELIQMSYSADRAPIISDGSRPEITEELLRMNANAMSVNFRKELTIMTTTAAQGVREDKVRIDPSFKDLIFQLTAVEYDDKGHPDKSKLNFDLGDAFMIAVDYLLRGGAGHSVKTGGPFRARPYLHSPFYSPTTYGMFSESYLGQ